MWCVCVCVRACALAESQCVYARAGRVSREAEEDRQAARVGRAREKPSTLGSAKKRGVGGGGGGGGGGVYLPHRKAVVATSYMQPPEHQAMDVGTPASVLTPTAQTPHLSEILGREAGSGSQVSSAQTIKTPSCVSLSLSLAHPATRHKLEKLWVCFPEHRSPNPRPRALARMRMQPVCVPVPAPTGIASPDREAVGTEVCTHRPARTQTHARAHARTHRDKHMHTISGC